MRPKKILSVLLCALAISPVYAIGLTNNTKAVSTSNINDSDVFVKQQQSNTCTLASNVMLLRRAAILRGDSNWRDITESSCRSSLWVEGCGMKLNYSYNGISVNCERIYGDSTETLRQLLKQHPEGIVAYDYNYPHAVLLTDYSDGVFYCSDPANCCGYGVIDARYSLVDTSGIEAYWYVSSPIPFVNNTVKNDVDDADDISGLSNNSYIDSSDVIFGDSVGIVFDAEGGAGGYKYEVDVKKPSMDDYLRLRNYTTAGSMTYRPWETGSYTLRINAKDDSGNIESTVVSFDVSTAALNNESVTDKDIISYGEDVTFNFASVGGAGGVKYEVQAIKPSGDSWITLRKNCMASSFVYHPWEAGTYYFKVIASDKEENTSDNRHDLYVGVDDLENNTTFESDALDFGSDLVFYPAAGGGTSSYKYEMNIKKPGSDEWINLRKYAPCGDSFKYHPWERGTYGICVNVKDSSGSEVSQYFYFDVY